MNRIVVFYSRADENYYNGQYRKIEIGNTEKAAMMIAEITGASLFKIDQKEAYAKDYNTCIKQAKHDLQVNARPELKELIDISDFDEIYLGYPNYWGTMPMAVYTFLEAFDFNGKIIYPFCTHEGSGLSDTEADIRKAAKNACVKKGIAIQGSLIEQAKKQIERWVQNEL